MITYSITNFFLTKNTPAPAWTLGCFNFVWNPSITFFPRTGALDQQKEMYEQKLEELRREKTPDSLMTGRTSSGYNSEDRLLNSTPTSFYDRSVNN